MSKNKEKEILGMLKAGATISTTAKKLGVKNHLVFFVRNKHRDEIPEKKRKILWSVRPPDKYSKKMILEIAERNITATELLIEIIGGWYGKI